MARKNDKDSTISHRYPKQIDQEAFDIMISDWNSKNENTKLQMRMLELSDCQPGSAYSQLIGSTSPDVPSPHDLQSWFSTKTHFPNSFHTFIISSQTPLTPTPIGSCSLSIEHKFFASLCTIGHISQIHITPTHPDPTLLQTILTNFLYNAAAHTIGCSRVILNCPTNQIQKFTLAKFSVVGISMDRPIMI